MIHFSKAINSIISRHHFGFAAEVANRAGISKAYITRLRHGDKKGITPKTLSKIVKAITSSDRERAELVAAHLKDESCGYFPDFIEIKIKRGNKNGNSMAASSNPRK